MAPNRRFPARLAQENSLVRDSTSWMCPDWGDPHHLRSAVGALNRPPRAVSADAEIRNVAVAEPDRDQPWVVGAPPTQLLYRPGEFLVLEARLAGKTPLGETGDEHERVFLDRLPEFPSPVLARPQVGSIPPHPHAGLFQPALQAVDMKGVLTHRGR